MLRIILIFTLCYHAAAIYYACSQTSALNILRKPIHEFSMHVLRRVGSDREGHFALAPLAAWLQLSALAEGAADRSATERELRRTLGPCMYRCLRNKLANLLKNNITTKYRDIYRDKSILVIDELLDVNPKFVHDLLKFYGVKVYSGQFSFPTATANKVNKHLVNPNRGPQDIIDKLDLLRNQLILYDNIQFSMRWKMPFDLLQTKVEPFNFNKTLVLGEVNMMSKVNYFNVCELGRLGVRAVEIPGENSISMIIFLPREQEPPVWAGNVFHEISKTTLSSIIYDLSFNRELVSLKLPRFKIDWNVDKLETYYEDMGIKELFEENRRDLSRMTPYFHDISLMLVAQVGSLEVVEEGVSLDKLPPDPVVDQDDQDDQEEFHANRPFAYLIIDKNLHLPLIGGMYSKPSLT